MAETMDWERLRSRARYLESELERSLPDLTRIARDTHSTGAEEARLSTAIEAALKELADVAERMGAEVERAPLPCTMRGTLGRVPFTIFCTKPN